MISQVGSRSAAGFLQPRQGRAEHGGEDGGELLSVPYLILLPLLQSLMNPFQPFFVRELRPLLAQRILHILRGGLKNPVGRKIKKYVKKGKKIGEGKWGHCSP